tara:strand:+ start:56 stop:388 length:333 start_codon:yes stop_codon:yes gene_type:complete
MFTTRNYTIYETDSTNNEKIKDKYGIKTNREYKEFLINNTESIIKRNKYEIILDNNTNLFETLQETNHPYKYENIYDKKTPKGYIESDLKNEYLSREELNASKKRNFIRT